MTHSPRIKPQLANRLQTCILVRMTTFHLIRHAANDWIGQALAGWLPEVHLNEAGRQQASHLPDRFSPGELHRLFSSPLDRAVQTATPLSERFNLQIELCEAIGEVRFGDWTSRKLSDLEHHSDWQDYNSFRSGAAVPNGEFMIETQTRAVSQFLRWRSAFPNQTIAAVSHADTIKAVVAYFLGVPLDLFNRIEISPASISTIQLGNNWCRVLCVNHTLH